MKTKTSPKFMPKITGNETGWRRSFAIYRSLVDFEPGEGYDKIRKNDYRSTIAAISNIVSHHRDIFDAYSQCELIEKYTESDVDVLRMARILAQHGITDIADWDGDFASISGIGSTYAKILEAARNYAKNALSMVSLHVRIPVYIRDQLQKEADKSGTSMSQLIRDIVFEYATKGYEIAMPKK